MTFTNVYRSHKFHTTYGTWWETTAMCIIILDCQRWPLFKTPTFRWLSINTIYERGNGYKHKQPSAIVKSQKYVSQNMSGNSVQLLSTSWITSMQLEKSLKAIADGPKKKLGITWHGELIDKPHPIRTHAYYEGNPATLRSILLNSVEHYKVNHAKQPLQNRSKLSVP